jgi:hypothetical protein
MAQGKQYKVNEADRIFVERAVMAGTAINTIAQCLNLSDDTLRKHFRYEIVTGRERLKGDAVRVLIDSLTDNSLDAAKYVLSRVAGWTEKSVVDNTSSDGTMTPKPTMIKFTAPDLGDASDD